MRVESLHAQFTEAGKETLVVQCRMMQRGLAESGRLKGWLMFLCSVLAVTNIRLVSVTSMRLLL